MSNKYILEVGVEELPARYINETIEKLKSNVEKALTNARINYKDIETFSTPRRLTLIISELLDTGESEITEVKGPAKRIALDESDKPTKALLGFMKGQGVGMSDISFRNLNGEEYVYALVKSEGKSLKEVLETQIPEAIKNITFPKSMKWGGKSFRFARPIRWLVSMLNDEILSFELEGIIASNVTRGHRVLGSDKISIDRIDNYLALLKENFVIADFQKRKEIIRYQSEKLAREVGGHLQQDDSLLDEVTNLVEFPTPIIGKIKDEYLALPFDVVTTPMKEHQRYFPVLDDKERLLPYFITVRNGNEDYSDIVVKGNEKVLGARLEDAKFFYKEDIKNPLESYNERLRTVTFQEKLGSVYDKSIRIRLLTKKIADYLEVGEETTKNAERAAVLSKADLVTKMVSEFTELQGKIGMEYANTCGEKELVSLAIFEQYLPRFSGDKLPTTTAGAILAIADKLDSICGLFAIGIQPTGSQDPFALRRAAIGIINIIIDRKLNISLTELIEFSLYIYVEENGLAFDYTKARNEIKEFFLGRVRALFLDLGIPYDIMDSIIHTDTDNIYDMKIRGEKLTNWMKNNKVDEVLAAFNRVSNLAIKTESEEVKRDLLTDEGLKLYDQFNEIEDEVDSMISKKEYDLALSKLANLKEPIDNFFDKVMIMVDDEEIKNNRLALLRKVYNKMMKVCDLTYITKD